MTRLRGLTVGELLVVLAIILIGVVPLMLAGWAQRQLLGPHSLSFSPPRGLLYVMVALGVGLLLGFMGVPSEVYWLLWLLFMLAGVIAWANQRGHR
jgi:hypothetical protein